MQPDNSGNSQQPEVTAVAPIAPEPQNVNPQPAAGGVVYAGVGSRFVAVFLDGLILGFVGFIISFIFQLLGLVAGGGDSAGVVATIVKSIGSLIVFGIQIAYAIYFIGTKGQTPGKMAMKIKVVKEGTNEHPDFTKAFLREVVGKFVSSLVFALGYLWAIWDPKKQTWHDKMAGTIVVKV